MNAVEGFIPIPREAAERYVADRLWSTDETLPSILSRVARTEPDRRAVIDDSGRVLTYAELEDASQRLAAALEERGLGSGDVVGVQLPNRAEAVVVATAVERIGGIVNPLVPIYRNHELEYMSRKCRSKALVVPGTYRAYDHEAMALRVAKSVPSVETIITLGTAPSPGTVSLEALLEQGGRSSAYAAGTHANVPLDPDAIAAILFTSGTEASPKGVLHTHNTLLANLRSLARILELDERDVIFMPSPVGHGTGYGFGIRLALFLGAKLILQDEWKPARALELMSEEGASYTHASTPFAHDLLRVAETVERDLTKLRWFVTGGASIPTGFVARVREKLGCSLLRLYGQTEAFMTTLNRPDDSIEILETRDGRPVFGVEMQIWDDEGNVVPPGEPGEAVCRGPHRCVGFVLDEERARTTITEDGWLRMGDYCTLDENGYATVVGRKKDVINRGGYKFSPLEVEDLLHTHPDVLRVAIVRMADERLGERACMYTVARPGSSPRLEDFVDFLRARGVAPYKWPERLEVIDEMPTTPSGKIQKFILEERLRLEAAAKTPTA